MNRRDFIKDTSFTALSMSSFGSLIWDGKAFVGNSPTTTDILGPFYRPGAPMKSNLRIPGSSGTPIVLKGIVFEENGTTPIKGALVEIWHCDEEEYYDNASDDYKYRGGQKTNLKGKYEFKTILPVPYKADANNDESWRPAHIHLRISVPNQQDLVTQIYFKDGKYVDTDRYASAPGAINRILNIQESASGEKVIEFNVILNKEIPLDDKVFEKLTGIYSIGEGNYVEFIKSDDALLLKRNGALVSSLVYIGNNMFEGSGTGFPKVSFELAMDGSVETKLTTTSKTYSGVKYLKYK